MNTLDQYLVKMVFRDYETGELLVCKSNWIPANRPLEEVTDAISDDVPSDYTLSKILVSPLMA